jgi:hypothetical protein
VDLQQNLTKEKQHGTLHRKPRKGHSEKQALSLILVNDEIFKDSTKVANAFNHIFITITEKLNSLLVEKGDAISVLKDSFPENLPSIKILPIEAKTKSIIQSLKPIRSIGYFEILKA